MYNWDYDSASIECCLSNLIFQKRCWQSYFITMCEKLTTSLRVAATWSNITSITWEFHNWFGLRDCKEYTLKCPRSESSGWQNISSTVFFFDLVNPHKLVSIRSSISSSHSTFLYISATNRLQNSTLKGERVEIEIISALFQEFSNQLVNVSFFVRQISRATMGNWHQLKKI